MSRWVRLWVDMPTDPKWRVIAKRAGRPISETLAVFMFMMANAGERHETQCNAEERGVLVNWSDEDVAAALDLETGHVTAIREAMQGKTLDGDKLTGWEKRQPKREDISTERVRAFRKRNETQGNAPDSDSEEIREELTTTTEQVAPREIKKVLKEALTRGVGGEVSVESRRRVAKTLGISDPGPIVEAYHRLHISRQAKQPDALFESQAPKIWQRASPEVRAACQPISAMEDAAVVVAKPSPYLVASLSTRRHRHA